MRIGLVTLGAALKAIVWVGLVRRVALQLSLEDCRVCVCRSHQSAREESWLWR